MTLASGYDLVVFDLDGVVYLGTRPVPGAAEAIRALADAGIAVAYATNNASRRPAEVAELLGSMGVPARAEEVTTSAGATAQVLAADLPPGAPVLPVGAPALVEELAAAGLTPVTSADERPVAVVQGYGPEVGWAVLAEACVAIRAGARWVATNTDTTLPSPRGPLPGNGALVAAVSTALGGLAPDTVVGKPSPQLLTAAAQRRGANRAVVVGDRLDTDIEGAQRAGMDSLLVLTGVTTPSELLAAPAVRRPTHLAADCAALHRAEEDSRIPPWRAVSGSASAGAWQVTLVDDHLLLALASAHATGDADPVDALRALARAAWECPQWTAIRSADPAAERALADLGLGSHAAWAVPAPLAE